MSESILRNKSKTFAKDIVFLCREIKANYKELVLANQLLRSGTSIGANIHEAQYAQSKKDFISKLEIVQKECYKTEYWLELLFETNCIEETKFKKIHNDCGARHPGKFCVNKNSFQAKYEYQWLDFTLKSG